MDFEEFERLERFNLLDKDIAKLNYHSSLEDKKTTPKKGGLTIKNTGEYERT